MAAWDHLRLTRFSTGLMALLSLSVVWIRTDYGLDVPFMDEWAAWLLLLAFLALTLSVLYLFTAVAVAGPLNSGALGAAWVGGLVLMWFGVTDSNVLLVLGVTATAFALACTMGPRPAQRRARRA